MTIDSNNTEIVEGYTRDEVIHEIRKWTGRKLSVSAFYRWLPFCLCEAKPIYSKRDVQKFLFISKELKRVRRLEIAKELLIKRLESNDEVFDYGT
jgi:hypothetical protein